MRKKHLLIFAMGVILLGLLLMISCTGGGHDGVCAEPITLTPGTWCITIQSTQNTCNQPLDSTPYPATFTQSGSSLSATTAGATFAGTICGSTAHMSGNAGGVTSSISLTFSDPSHATGSTDWAAGTCTGTDTFIAVAGSCP